jgi:transporter family protein
MEAVILAFLTAIFWGIRTSIARKGLGQVDLLTGTFITFLVAFPILFIFASITGEYANITNLTPQSLVSLAVAGVLMYALARTFAFNSVKTIGSARAGQLMSTELVFAAIFSSIIIREFPSIILTVGLVSVLIGVVSITRSQKKSSKENITRRDFSIGLITGLGSGIIWGFSDTLIRLGMINWSSPILGNLVAYFFASMIFSTVIFGTKSREKLRKINRNSIVFLVLVGALSTFGTVTQFMALNLASVSAVVPITSTNSLITLIFSYTFLRKHEVINLNVIIGALLIVGGTYIVIIS